MKQSLSKFSLKGLSKDGTSRYINTLKSNNPTQIYIHRTKYGYKFKNKNKMIHIMNSIEFECYLMKVLLKLLLD